jgi:hypothetical protein
MENQMKFKLTITVDNEAFKNDPRPELARILKELSKRVTGQESLAMLKFEGVPVWNIINGNRVGIASITEP